MSRRDRTKSFVARALSVLFSRDWLVNAVVTGCLLLVLEYDVLVLAPTEWWAAVLLHALLVGTIVVRVQWEAIQEWMDEETSADVEDE